MRTRESRVQGQPQGLEIWRSAWPTWDPISDNNDNDGDGSTKPG